MYAARGARGSGMYPSHASDAHWRHPPWATCMRGHHEQLNMMHQYYYYSSCPQLNIQCRRYWISDSFLVLYSVDFRKSYIQDFRWVLKIFDIPYKLNLAHLDKFSRILLLSTAVAIWPHGITFASGSIVPWFKRLLVSSEAQFSTLFFWRNEYWK